MKDKEYQEHYSPDGERLEYLMEHPEENDMTNNPLQTIKEKAREMIYAYATKSFTVEELADDVETHLISAYESGRREVEEKAKSLKRQINPGGATDKSLENAHIYGYNQALNDILSTLVTKE
jgi:hypothetical protein